MYYNYSLIITILVFIFFQLNEYNNSKKNNKKYELFSMTNLLYFIVSYIFLVESFTFKIKTPEFTNVFFLYY